MTSNDHISNIPIVIKGKKNIYKKIYIIEKIKSIRMMVKISNRIDFRKF